MEESQTKSEKLCQNKFWETAGREVVLRRGPEQQRERGQGRDSTIGGVGGGGAGAVQSVCVNLERRNMRKW